MSTDKDWEKWGKSDPYFGVLSDNRFKGRKLESILSDEFYSSGRGNVVKLEELIKTINSELLPKFDSTVDFGCGVGRITVPLTQLSKKVTGLDVSPSMLKVAERNTPSNLKKRINYALSDDQLTMLPKNYDLVYSNIVLQHIPPKRGYKIIEKLLTNLQQNGFAALHVTYQHQAPRHRHLVIVIRSRVLAVHYFLNILRGRRIATPLMRMHLYHLDKVLGLFYGAGVSEVYVELTNHGGYLGAMIVGKKTQDK